MAQPNGNMNIIDIIKMKMLMSVGTDKPGEIQSSIYVMIIMFVISMLEQNLNIIFKTIKTKINDKYNSIVLDITKSSNLTFPTNDIYNIFLEKDLSKESKTQLHDKYLEAVLYNISEKHNLKSVMYFKSLYIVNVFTQFQIDDDIYGKIHKLEYDSEFNITRIKLQISSDTTNVVQLKKYIENCYDIYKRKIQNNLGSDLYFFDQRKSIIRKKNDETREYPPYVTFEHTKFNTNRKFNNVFGENINILKKRVIFFKNNKEWYDQKGIPYTFGALLHGPAGTGKSSIIKAIANECHRHIININLKEIKTNTQLKNLFYKSNLICQDSTNINQLTFELDIQEKIYVIEDIDCMSEIVLDRKMSSNLEDINQYTDTDTDTDQEQDIQENIKDQSHINKTEYCKECELGHHEEHCYNVIKKFCPHCICINKKISKCNKCKNLLEHCDKNGHCENYLGIINPRRCTFCLNKNERKDFELLQIEKNKNVYNSNSGNFASFNSTTIEHDDDNDLITLSSLLNILDGTLELPGRMLIITSNYPEKLDKALIRPGRIDLILNLTRASILTIKEMYESFYTLTLDEKYLKFLQNDKWTPAEINCIFFNNFDNPKCAIDDIINTEPSSITKFT